MEQKNLNDDKGLVNHNWGIKDEINAGYKATQRRKFSNNPEFTFIWKNGIRVFFERDYGVWCVSVYRNWNSPSDFGEQLLDRRGCNLDKNYNTIKWSNKVVDRAVELIESVI